MKKYLHYAILPALGLALLGVGTASAHGFLWGSNATPEEIGQKQNSMFTQQAGILGISVEDMKNYWAEGKSIKDIAQEKGITEDQLKTKMQEQMKQKMQEQLNTLVQQGIITQGQADQRKTVMEARINSGMGGGMRGMHMMGGWHF